VLGEKKFKGFWLMIRPSYTVFVLLVAFAGMFFATRRIDLSFLLPLLVIGLHYIAVCIKDDIEDREVDRIIGKTRPLVQNLVSLKEAYVGWLLLHILAVPLSLIVGFYFFLIMIFYIPIGIIYTQRPLRVSDKSLLGNVFCGRWMSVALDHIG
jgi:4-hydroxybenzoate polyprenyltransferase